MAQNTAYPEPDANPDAMHPYSHEYQMPSDGHSNITYSREASMRRDSNNSGIFIQGNNNAQPSGQPSTPQQLAQRSLDMNQGPGQNNQDLFSRKRSKVSRACDECRRKKIRCDAESESPGTQCSSCRRAGSHCDFSRAPQKRGPSKGYIKELAERVNFLEYKTGAAPPEMPYPAIAPENHIAYAPSGEFGNRKRAHNSFAGPSSYDNSYNTLSDLQPKTQRPPLESLSSEGLSGAEALKPATGAQPKQRQMNATVFYATWINAYYDLIHPWFPLLPRDVATLQYNVETVCVGLCDAFFGALEAAITACTTTDSKDSMSAASDQLTLLQADPEYTATPLSKLVHLQALILMIIATDNRGPSHDQKSQWISRAVDVATTLKLHHQDDQERDPHDHGGSGRHAWLILFILDRWHAVGYFDILRVPELNCKLIDHDRKLLGNTAFHLFRISRSLGHLYEIFIYSKDDSTSPPPRAGPLTTVLDEVIESFRESTSQEWRKMPQIHLVYLHVRILADRYLEAWATKSGAIVSGALQIVMLLRHKKGIYCAPWINHITAHTAVTLGEIADRKLHPGAPAVLHELRDGLETALFRPHNGKTAWDRAISAYITRKLDYGNQSHVNDNASDRGDLREGLLSRLADAAVGNTEDTNATGDAPLNRTPYLAPDWTVANSTGYMNLFE